MANANSIETALDRLNDAVLGIVCLVQIISRTEAPMREPEASFVWLLSHVAEPLNEAFGELEVLLREKISAAEVVNG
ncbi:hypothetical protein ACI2S5_15960 [Ralstonia nicotianae]